MQRTNIVKLIQDCNNQKDFFTAQEEEIPGWCPSELAAFLNQLVQEMPIDQSYLEIGTFCGRSLRGALRNNPDKKAIVIDPLDLITGKGSIDDLWHQIMKHHEYQISLYKQKSEDFVGKLPPIGVFFYDGNHDSGHTFEALNKFLPFMAKDSIIVVDDLNIYGGDQQTPYPGHEIDIVRPVKTDVDRWCALNNKTYLEASWLNGQAIIEL